MAFTEKEELDICRVLGVSPLTLKAHLIELGDDLTDTVEEEVLAELERWASGAGSDFVRVHPKERNFGAEINPSDERADIKRNIAILLQLDVALLSVGLGRTVRG